MKIVTAKKYKFNGYIIKYLSKLSWSEINRKDLEWKGFWCLIQIAIIVNVMMMIMESMEDESGGIKVTVWRNFLKRY